MQTHPDRRTHTHIDMCKHHSTVSDSR